MSGCSSLIVVTVSREIRRPGTSTRVATAVAASVSSMADPLAWLTSLEGVSSAYASTRDGIDVMLRDRGLRRTSPEMTAESLLRGAHASAVLEGSSATAEQVRTGEVDEIAADAIRLSATMLALAPLLKTAPLQAIARLHAVVAASTLGPEELGRPRDAASADRLRGVAELLLSDTEAPALLVAAVAHADVATAAPFASHNGIVARALERLVLVSRGVDAKSLIVPEAGHLAQRAAYESNLRAYRDGGRARGPRVGALRRRGLRGRCRGLAAAVLTQASGTRTSSGAAADTCSPWATKRAFCKSPPSRDSRMASTPSDGWIAAWVPGARVVCGVVVPSVVDPSSRVYKG